MGGGAMKVVIFCGGLGVRMGEETQRIPKPMIRIGNRPILWHIMRYYAAWGHTEFVLCLGYKGDVIKDYFLSHNEALFNDFVLDGYGAEPEVEIFNRDGGPWRITFADTGTRSTIGERLKLVEPYLGGDETFMATYGDGLTDVDLPSLVRTFESSGKMIMFALVRPHFHAHIVQADPDGTVRDVRAMDTAGVRINGGFFVMKREIFDWIAARRRARRGDVRETDPAGRGRGVHPRWVLRADGHDQGPAVARGALRLGSRAVAPRRPRPGRIARRVMLSLGFAGDAPLRRVLAIGAHSDDLEIGCGGTILTLARANPGLAVDVGRPRRVGRSGGRGAPERGAAARRRGRELGRRARLP